jgi:hypothetical protein
MSSLCCDAFGRAPPLANYIPAQGKHSLYCACNQPTGFQGLLPHSRMASASAYIPLEIIPESTGWQGRGFAH